MSSYKLYTLVFIMRDSEILLGFKKRGFGSNKWNGFGGKVESEETILDAAHRELLEECNLTTKELEPVGRLEFTFEGEPTTMDVRVFVTSNFSGELKETEEMIPKWFQIKDIPYEGMWPDDKWWFPYLLANKKFHGKFLYKGFEEIIMYTVKEVGSSSEFLEK